MVIDESCAIGGQIVGLGVVHADGSEDFRWLGKPIHNRITSVGLDHLLCYSGSATGGYTIRTNSSQPPNLWLDSSYGSGSYTRKGVLTYCRIGTGSSQAEFTDTDLANAVTDYTSNLRTGSPYCGTKVNGPGSYKIRVTHTSGAVSSDCTIREFGLYGRYVANSSPTYPLFARIVLDQGVSLSAGDSLLVTYELSVSHNTDIVHMSNFFDMLDSEGNPLQCDISLYNPCSPTTGFTGSLGKYVYVTQSATDSIASAYTYFESYPPYIYHGTKDSGDMDTIGYSTNTQNFGVADATLSKARSDSGDYSFSFADYAGVGNNDKHRDVVVTMGTYNPGMQEPSSYIDIYFLRFRGMDYKFGYTDADDNFVPQALRKWARQTMTFTFRTRYVTPDTIQMDGSDPSQED